jgi:hypothetical protein
MSRDIGIGGSLATEIRDVEHEADAVAREVILGVAKRFVPLTDGDAIYYDGLTELFSGSLCLSLP